MRGRGETLFCVSTGHPGRVSLTRIWANALGRPELSNHPASSHAISATSERQTSIENSIIMMLKAIAGRSGADLDKIVNGGYPGGKPTGKAISQVHKSRADPYSLWLSKLTIPSMIVCESNPRIPFFAFKSLDSHLS